MFTYMWWSSNDIDDYDGIVYIMFTIFWHIMISFFTIPLDIMLLPLEILVLIIYKIFYKNK